MTLTASGHSGRTRCSRPTPYPDECPVWLLSGALLVFMAISGTVLKRLTLMAAMLCLGAGFALGPAGAGLFEVSFPSESGLLKHITEVAVVISLFTVGLKLRVGIRGIGSIYYLTYAVNHGLPADLGTPLTTVAFLAVAVSIVVHGISATPLMDQYARRARGK